MPVVKQWTVDIHLSEHPEDEAVHTYAEAPERALSDLAGQLLRAAPDDIEAVTHQPAGRSRRLNAVGGSAAACWERSRDRRA